MVEALLGLYANNLDYARRLVADLPDGKIAVQPAPGVNHAAWVIGHLARTADSYGKQLGGTETQPGEWAELFGGKSTPSADRGKYPTMAVLLKALEDGHARMGTLVRAKDAAYWATQTPNEARRVKFPTMGHMLVHILINHEAIHLGQLSAWRRVQGLPPV